MRSITASLSRLPLATVLSTAALNAFAPAAPPAPPAPRPLTVRVEDGGFRWGEAGIGAAAGFGAGLVLAGSLALAGRRDDRDVVHVRHEKEE